MGSLTSCDVGRIAQHVWEGQGRKEGRKEEKRKKDRKIERKKEIKKERNKERKERWLEHNTRMPVFHEVNTAAKKPHASVTVPPAPVGFLAN